MPKYTPEQRAAIAEELESSAARHLRVVEFSRRYAADPTLPEADRESAAAAIQDSERSAQELLECAAALREDS